ncbi:MAG: hypothetical protein JWQ98_2143 [Chlorobi bacterium]|nr:hypothetical protein [Chlorobiota bacterium]
MLPPLKTSPRNRTGAIIRREAGAHERLGRFIGHQIISAMHHHHHYQLPSPRLARTLSGCLTLIALMILAMPAAAQNFVTIDNQFVTASICTDKPAAGMGGGRFYITASPANGRYNLLYATTSNVVFRVVANGYTSYFSSTGNGGTGGQPLIEGIPTDHPTPVPYIPYTSLTVSPTKDTVETTWKAAGFTIIQRLFLEKPRTLYDVGGDVVIEFEWMADSSAANSELGIFMMLDLYNGQAAGSGGSADYTSVVTSQGYFPVEQGGKLFTPPFDTIPDWYHAGNFLFQAPVNTILPIHRLKGTTHGGLPVNTPDIFAIGDWINYLRYYSWDISSADVSKPFHDGASAMRWGHLTGSGKIRTAYGMDDRTGNNLYHCRDTAVFIDIKTERLVEQRETDSGYLASKFNVDVWVANTNPTGVTDMTVTMTQPIGGANGKNRLTLDPATPSPVGHSSLPPRATRHFQWTIDVAPGTNDSLLDIPLEFKYQYNTGKAPRVLKVPCSPIITLRQYPDTTQDHQPPAITHDIGTPYLFPVAINDRHQGYIHDTGLDTLRLTSNSNFLVTQTTPDVTRCDTTFNLHSIFKVIDTTKPARITFCVYDCRGNSTCDSVIYKPAASDVMPPIIFHSLSVGTSMTVIIRDRHPGYHDDSGLDRIVMTTNVNNNVFVTPLTAFTRCDTTVDVNATFTVIDSTKAARVIFCAYDCQGNATCDSLVYRPAVAGAPADAAIAGMAFTRSYPNPVSGILTIEYRLQAAGDVSLRLYNTAGARIMAFDGGSEKPGVYSRGIDMSALPAGGYRLTLTQNGITVSQPVTVVR